MDWLDLKILVELAECRSISKISQKLPLSYSAINSRLINLENEINVPLFLRTPRGTELTAAGERFYYFAEKSLTNINAGMQAARHQGSSEKASQSFQLGATRPLLHIVVPIFSQLMKQQNGIGQWNIRSGDTMELVHLSQGDELHAAVVNQEECIPDNLEKLLLFEEPLYLVGPPEYRLPDFNDLYHILERIPLVLMKKGFPLRELIEKEIFKTIGFKPHQLIEVDTTEVIKEMIKQGIGFSILPASSLWLDHKVYPSSSEVTFYRIDIKRNMTQKFFLIFSPYSIESHGHLLHHLFHGVQERVKSFRKMHKPPMKT